MRRGFAPEFVNYTKRCTRLAAAGDKAYQLFAHGRWFSPDTPATGTCFIQKIYAPSSSLLQGKHLPFSSSPLRLNIFRLFVILSLTQLYRYTPEIFLFSTATFKYNYRAPLRRIGKEYSAYFVYILILRKTCKCFGILFI